MYHCLIAAAHQVEEGRLEEIERRRQPRPQQHQQGKADPHDPGGLPVIPPAPGNGKQGRAPGTAEVGKGGNNVRCRHHQPDTGKSVPPNGVNVPNKGPVHHIIEDNGQLGHRQRDCQGEDIFRDAPLGKVIFSPLSHIIPPICFFLL